MGRQGPTTPSTPSNCRAKRQRVLPAAWRLSTRIHMCLLRAHLWGPGGPASAAAGDAEAYGAARALRPLY